MNEDERTDLHGPVNPTPTRGGVLDKYPGGPLPPTHVPGDPASLVVARSAVTAHRLAEIYGVPTWDPLIFHRFVLGAAIPA